MPIFVKDDYIRLFWIIVGSLISFFIIVLLLSVGIKSLCYFNFLSKNAYCNNLFLTAFIAYFYLSIQEFFFRFLNFRKLNGRRRLLIMDGKVNTINLAFVFVITITNIFLTIPSWLLQTCFIVNILGVIYCGRKIKIIQNKNCVMTEEMVILQWPFIAQLTLLIYIIWGVARII